MNINILAQFMKADSDQYKKLKALHDAVFNVEFMELAIDISQPMGEALGISSDHDIEVFCDLYLNQLGKINSTHDAETFLIETLKEYKKLCASDPDAQRCQAAQP